jgi:thiol-disulfide isomerase/thioredoxin
MSDEPGSDRDRERPRSTSRYSIYVGIAFLILIAVATYNTFRTKGGGVLGGNTADVGEALSEFAVPELIGGADADANVFQDDCSSSDNPCPADDRRTPACEVDLPHVLRVCDFFDKPLVISFWFSTPSDCPPTQDAVNAAAERWRGKVNFIAIAVRGDRDELARIVEQRGWTIPVGWDRDGAVSNLYRVGVCPTVAFVRTGGVLEQAKIGSDELERDRFDADIERLVDSSRRLAENPR